VADRYGVELLHSYRKQRKRRIARIGRKGSRLTLFHDVPGLRLNRSNGTPLLDERRCGHHSIAHFSL